MNLSNDAFSMPLDDTPGSLLGDSAGLPIVGVQPPLDAVGPSRAVLSQRCGYASEAEFLKESRKVATIGSVQWFATCDKVRGGWVIWREPPVLLTR